MSMLAQTNESDILVANNSFSLVNRKAEIRQKLINNLRSFLTEWFLDVTLGVPWFQIVFEDGTSPEVIETTVKNAILDTEGIISLEVFVPLDYDPKTRLLTVNFTAKTVDGDLIKVSEVIGP